MAVLLLKAEHGSSHEPPSCIPPGVFLDVACPGLYTDWVEELAAEEITQGCGEDVYCPDSPVRRDQMAVFLLKAGAWLGFHSSGLRRTIRGRPVLLSGFADWVEQLVVEGITAGCGGGNYCPDSSIARVDKWRCLCRKCSNCNDWRMSHLASVWSPPGKGASTKGWV